jgi:hypothetical protein
MRHFMAFVFALACTMTGARAQQFNPQAQNWLNRSFAAVQNTIDEVRKMYRPHLTAQQQSVMDSTVVSIPRNDWDIYDAYAIAPPAVPQRTIVLSAGALMMYDMADRAIADAIALADTDAAGDYLVQLAQHIDEATKATAVGQPAPGITPYCEWRGNPPADCIKLRAMPQYANNFALIKLGSIGLLYAHELGHHVYQHETQPTRARLEKESEADEFAVKLMLRSDLNPVMGMGLFSLMAALEGAPPDRPQDRKHHPYAICRLYKAYNLGYAELLNDPQYVAYLTQRGTLQKVKDQLDQFKSIVQNNVQC